MQCLIYVCAELAVLSKVMHNTFLLKLCALNEINENENTNLRRTLSIRINKSNYYIKDD